MATDTELTTDQELALARLSDALNGLGDALVNCRDNGMEPAAAFRAAGIPIPAFAGPALNVMFQSPDDEQLQ